MLKVLDWIEEIICVLCTIVMTVLVFANVISRYLLHSSLSFSEEITTYLFVLLSMMGTAIAAKRRAHLGLSIITDAVGPKAHKPVCLGDVRTRAWYRMPGRVPAETDCALPRRRSHFSL